MPDFQLEKYTPRYEEMRNGPITDKTSTKLIPIIQGFHIGKFTCSLKLISNPQINT